MLTLVAGSRLFGKELTNSIDTGLSNYARYSDAPDSPDFKAAGADPRWSGDRLPVFEFLPIPAADPT